MIARIVKQHAFLLPAGLLCALAAAAAAQDSAPVWRQDFLRMPPAKQWEVKTKPGTPAAVFNVVCDPAGSTNCWLNMTADKASASFCANPEIDLNQTPILRWSWRATTLPTGADGRDSAKDDQAIGIYIGTGGFFSQKSVAYRWETETPVGAEGTASYAAGVVKVAWVCLQNRNSDTTGVFIVETRNVADDFKKFFGFIPDSVTVGISCNSQYTKSKAEAQLQWIEFLKP